MSNAVQLTQNEWTKDQTALVKRTVCRDATDDELKLFMHICQRTGLDPFARQIYGIKRKNETTGIAVLVPQTSIDGFRLIASRSKGYAGSDEPIFDDEKEPNRATVTVYKMVQGQRCAFTATARWQEYYPGEKMGFMWRKMPCVMLGKCAESLALRKAFPADLSGLYTEEEMEQAPVALPKGFVQELVDSGQQKLGYHFPAHILQLQGKHVDDCPTEKLKAFVEATEKKYVGKEIPSVTKEAYDEALNAILLREGVVTSPEEISEWEKEVEKLGVIK